MSPPPRQKSHFSPGQGHPFHYKGSPAKTNIIFESFIIFLSGNGLKQHVLVLDAAEPAVEAGCTETQCQQFKASRAEGEETG